MSSPFIGEIRMVGFNFAPRNWASCSGQLMSIAQNTALFSLLGTTFGGNGQTTFALPDLRGRIPIHQGQTFVMGEMSGTESVTLLASQMPAHSHAVIGSSGDGTTTSPSGAVPASGGPPIYAATPGNAPQMVSTASGGSQPHENMAPFLGINYVINLFGIFPSRN